MQKNISILGCGWLGLPLANHFLLKGFEVAGSTTSQDKLPHLRQLGINACHIALPTDDSQLKNTFLRQADYLIIDIPPQTRSKGPDHHKKCIQSFLDSIPSKQKVIYISATSVYPPLDELIDEKTPLNRDSDRSMALIQVEELLRAALKDRLTILRMGGLLGYDRIPGKYSAGKKVEGGSEKVNYIHRDDAVNIIGQIISDEIWGEVFNVVAPYHPTKQAVFEKNAEEFNFEKSTFVSSETANKKRKISSDKLVRLLDYSFIYLDPMDFYYTN